APRCVRDALLGREARGFGDHPRVGVDTDDLLEKVSDAERDYARPAADVEKTAAAVEPQSVTKAVSETRCIRQAAPDVVGGRPREEGLVPLPALPAAIGHDPECRKRNYAPQRYPIPASVRKQMGRSGLASSLRRICPT